MCQLMVVKNDEKAYIKTEAEEIKTKPKTGDAIAEIKWFFLSAISTVNSINLSLKSVPKN